VALAVLAAFLALEHQREVAEHDLLARVPVGDERTFVEWAHAVAAGKDDAVPYQAPLYPVLLGAIERAGGDVSSDARLLQALLGLAACGLAARIAWELTKDRRVSLVAFFLSAFARPLIHAEGTLLRETAAAAVLAALALAYVRARTRGRAEDHAALGLALGLGLVLRENFAVVALFVLAERLLAAARKRDRKSLAGLALLVVGAAIPVLPFDVKVARLGGGVHLLPNWNQGCVFYLANRRDNKTQGGYEPPPFVKYGNPEAEVAGFEEEAERRTGRALRGHDLGRYWLREGLLEVARAPGGFAARVAHRALTSIAPFETAHQRDLDFDAERSWVLELPLIDMGVLLALALLGAIASMRAASEGEGALLVLAGSWWLSLLAAAFTTRYRVPAIPLLAVLGALGARSLAGLSREDGRRKLLLYMAFAAIVGLQVLRFFRAPSDHSNAIRSRGLAALWLAEHPSGSQDPRDYCAQATRDLETFLAAHPDDPGIRSQLADAYMRLGLSYVSPPQPLEARNAFARAVALDPARKVAWHSLGICELSLRRPHAALEALLRADAADPEVQRHLAFAREGARSGEDRALPPRR